MTLEGGEAMDSIANDIDTPIGAPEVMIAEQEALRLSALKKLQKLGLTEDEAKAVIGM